MTQPIPPAQVPLSPAARARLDDLSRETRIPVPDLVDLIVLGFDHATLVRAVLHERGRRTEPSDTGGGLHVPDPSNSPAGPHENTPAHPFPE